MSKKSAANLLHSHLADKQAIALYLQLRGKQFAKPQLQVQPVFTTKESCKTVNATKWYDTAKAECNNHKYATKNNSRNITRNDDVIFSFNINPLWRISTTTTTSQQHLHHSNNHYYNRHRNKCTLHNSHHHYHQRHANNTQHHHNTDIKANLAIAEHSQHHHQQQKQQNHPNVTCCNTHKPSMLVSGPNQIYHHNDKKGRLKNLKNTKYHHHQGQCHDEMLCYATSAKISQQHETLLSMSPKVCPKMSQHQEQQLLSLFHVVSPLKSKSTTSITKNLHHDIWQLNDSNVGVAPITSNSCSPLNGKQHFNLDHETVLQCFNSISRPSDQDVIFGNARLYLRRCYGWEKSRIDWLEQLERKQPPRQKIPSVQK